MTDVEELERYLEATFGEVPISIANSISMFWTAEELGLVLDMYDHYAARFVWREWLELDLWDQFEARCLLMGISPEIGRNEQVDRAWELVEPAPRYRAVQVAIQAGSIPTVNIDRANGEPIQKFRPIDFLSWCSQKSVFAPMPIPLRKLLERDETVARPPGRDSGTDSEDDGRKDRHARVREQVLGAALVCLAEEPDISRTSDGSVNASELARLVVDKAPRFWPGQYDPPLSPETIVNLLRKWLHRSGGE